MDSSRQPAFAQVENGEEAIAQKPGFSAKYQEGRFERSRTSLSGHDIKLNFESYGCGVKETSDYLEGPKCLFSCKSGLVYPILFLLPPPGVKIDQQNPSVQVVLSSFSLKNQYSSCYFLT